MRICDPSDVFSWNNRADLATTREALSKLDKKP
jgi:hypothetical protein